jgi:hypothetical protein
MKLKDYYPSFMHEGEIVAYFGNAKLVRRSDCKFELRGGSNEDRAEAREWISIFMHEAVVQ